MKKKDRLFFSTACCLASAMGILPSITHAETPEVRVGKITRLTNLVNSYPDASPDGGRVVFQSNRSGEQQIYVMNADGSGVEQLTDTPLGAETPVWSPDGEKIAYATYVSDGNNDVFIMNPDGSEKKQLTFGDGYDGHPHWSFDGSRIIFNSDRTSADLRVPWGERTHEIFSVEADGSNITMLSDCQAICTYGSMSPDGKKLLYRQVFETAGFNWDLSTGTRNSEIVVADADGQNARNISNNMGFDGWPVWSPEGDKILFASNRAGPARVGHLYIMNPDGTNVRRITKDAHAYAQPAWSKDARSALAYQFTETDEYEFGDVAMIEFIKE